MVDRTELLMKLYKRQSHWYKSTRRLTSVPLMKARLEEIKTTAQRIPLKKRTEHQEKKFQMEKKLIETKMMIYERASLSSSEGREMCFIKRWLEETDMRKGELLSPSEKKRRKARQTLLLMLIAYSSYDDDTLKKIVEKSNKLIC